MIDSIKQFCRITGCHPKDIAVQWSLQSWPILLARDNKGKVKGMPVPGRIDRVMQAIYLCATGQEDLYPRLLEQQAALEAKLHAWVEGDEGYLPQPDFSPKETRPPESKEKPKKDWHKLKKASEIMKAFPLHPTADDIIDLYQMNKVLKSDKLAGLLRMRSS